MVMGGKIKRLHNPYQAQTMIPRQLYEWDVVKIPLVTSGHCTVEDHSKKTMVLEDFQESSNTSRYSETSIHRFHGGLKKKQWIQENNR
jgi:hypothetical protein